MTEEKKDRSKELEGIVDETINEIDGSLKKSGKKLLNLLLDGAAEKMERAWNRKMVIIKHTIKSNLGKVIKEETKKDEQRAD